MFQNGGHGNCVNKIKQSVSIVTSAISAAKSELDFGQEGGKAYEATKFPEIEQYGGLIATNAIT